MIVETVSSHPYPKQHRPPLTLTVEVLLDIKYVESRRVRRLIYDCEDDNYGEMFLVRILVAHSSYQILTSPS